MGSNRIDRKRDVDGPVPTIIGEVAAVANAYDNLLTGDDTTPGVTPDVAIEEITKLAGTQFNQEIVQALRRVVPVYPLGCQVLVNGETFHNFRGIVTEVRPLKLHRPEVTLTHDAQLNAIERTKIDLDKMRDLSLKCIGL